MLENPNASVATWSPGVAVDYNELAHLRGAGECLKLGGDARVGTLLAGAHRSQFRGRGIEFAEVREYHPGDDPRSIDWRVTARTGKVHTKLFHEERERPVLFLVDQSSSMRFGTRRAFKSVLAARMAALLGFASLASGDRVGGVVLRDQSILTFRALRTRRRWLAMLKEVAGATQQSPATASTEIAGPTVEEAMRRLRPLTSPGCRVVLLSDFYRPGPGFESALYLLSKRTDLHLMQISDPLEQAAPPGARYRISDGVRIAEIDSGRRRVQDEWSAQFLRRQSYLEGLCRRHNAGYCLASTAMPAAEILSSSPLTRGR